MTSRRFPLQLALVSAGALAIRLVRVVTVMRGQLAHIDAIFYHAQANQLADGTWWRDPFAGGPTAVHPPLTSAIYGLVSLFGGRSVLAHQVASCALGAAAVVVIGLTAREVAGDRAGLFAAGLAAVYPGLWVQDGAVTSEPVAELAFAVVLWCAWRLWRNRTVAAGVWFGVAVGVATLARAEAGLLLFVLPWLTVRSWRSLATPVLVAAAVVAPWTAYNLTRFDRPVPVTTSGDFAIGGANCGLFYKGPLKGGWGLCEWRPVTGDESVKAAKLRGNGWRYARDHAGAVPGVTVARVARSWSVWWPFDHASQFLRRWEMAAQTVGVWLLVPLGVVGGFELRRRRVTLAPVWAAVGLSVVAAVVTWGTVRVRVPADVALLVFAGVAVDAWVRRPARRTARVP